MRNRDRRGNDLRPDQSWSTPRAGVKTVNMSTTSRSKRMSIGIIGGGKIGGTLARKLTALGHQVRVANSRGPASLEALARETGARAVTVEDAVREVELVIVAIPEKSVPDLPEGLLARVPEDVVIVDTGNYYPSRDGRIEAIERAATESRWVASVLGRPVVKCFNSIFVGSLAEGGRPKGAKDRIALPVAGDDQRAKSIVIALLDELGFDGVDAGSLDESWRQQPGTPVYCTDLSSDGVRRALAKADRVKAPQIRDLWSDKIRQLPAGTSPRELALMLRELAGATAL
jgi:predicted dinucleotide-binding enzyme